MYISQNVIDNSAAGSRVLKVEGLGQMERKFVSTALVTSVVQSKELFRRFFWYRGSDSVVS